MSEEKKREEEIAEHVRVVREGHGANCSSVGSVIDTLFVAQLAAGALLAAVAGALAASGTGTGTGTGTEEKGDRDQGEEVEG